MRSYHRTVRMAGVLSLVMALLLATISPAAAAQPTKTVIPLIGTQVLADCGNFQVLDDYYVMIEQTNFYDNSGKMTAIHQMINGTDTYRQSVTGQAITMGSHFMVRVDMETMMNSSAGMQYHLMLPGLGHVLLDAGRTVYDLNAGAFVFLAGTHQVATGDTAGLCAAFS